jgi:RecB family endonuclease NucS
MMNKQLLQQFKREAEAWNRSLEYLQSENAYLKTGIAEIVCDDLPRELLADIESFHNRSISKDEMISVARLQVWGFQSLVTEGNFQFINTEKIMHMHKSLKEHIEILESGFSKLKTEFNNYFKHKFIL